MVSGNMSAINRVWEGRPADDPVLEEKRGCHLFPLATSGPGQQEVALFIFLALSLLPILRPLTLLFFPVG